MHNNNTLNEANTHEIRPNRVTSRIPVKNKDMLANPQVNYPKARTWNAENEKTCDADMQR